MRATSGVHQVIDFLVPFSCVSGISPFPTRRKEDYLLAQFAASGAVRRFLHEEQATPKAPTPRGPREPGLRSLPDGVAKVEHRLRAPWRRVHIQNAETCPPHTGCERGRCEQAKL